MISRQKVLEFWRFIIGGGWGGVGSWVIYITFTKFLGVWYVLALFVGGVLNFVVNFFIHKFWTFKDMDVNHLRSQFWRYLAISSGRGIVNVLLLSIFVEWRHMDEISAQILATICLTLPSFFVTRWNFRK